ncbi:MAG: glycosyltransferase family 9 protein [Rhabdochlamydiaceae bacterium]|nr:glycosyltransferase family 9 protein [Candidatus Amphrikana amoebophyrae]
MKAAVITANGFGDGLIMMIASHQLTKAGYKVTTFNDHLGQIGDWFTNQSFQNQPKEGDDLSEFDLIILQHDNSKKSKYLIKNYRDKLTILYPSYNKNRHPKFTDKDFVFNGNKPIVCEVAKALSSLFNIEYCIENGLKIPSELTLKHVPSRIAIHPTSTTPLRTWTLSKFVAVAKWLLKRGYSPLFCLSPKERSELMPHIPEWIEIPNIQTLGDMAKVIAESQFVVGNESGIVHLASNLNIPFLVIAGNGKRIQQWQPGWRIGEVITPPNWVPNMKGMRLRENHWQHFIPTSQVTKSINTAMSEIK